MDAHNKARELMLLYYRLIPMCTVSFSRQCALIDVDNTLDELKEIMEITCSSFVLDKIQYYQEVKYEIEKL
jgi:hypothetical protein